jgi:hypothetical protein
LSSTVPGRANLASATGETIRIDFDADYTSPTPGSSAWNIVANNLRITVSVPAAKALPGWIMGRVLARTDDSGEMVLIDQCILLQNTMGREFGGLAPYPLLIRSGEEGLSTSYDQIFHFTFNGGSFDPRKIAALMDDPGASLTDPVSATPRFQTNLFFATPYATHPQSDWDSL